ncbi:hypothetical protein QM298_10510 [Pseudomonas mendocina]|nr:hypothetical protein [Pseudomonas mendocina]MDV5861339.1 hypothetical protein [Pseudomonas mendocina]
MSEQAVKRYWPEEIVGTGELVVYAQDYDALQSRLDAEQVGAAKLATKCVTLVNEAAYLRQQLSERNAVLRETADSLRCSKVFPALLESIDALLSSAEPVKAEFCCELSFKAAKQAAWDARRMDRCKCDHNEYCEHCWPDDFKEGGKWHGGFETKQSAPERVSVPRDLLADLISSDHDTKIQAERALYALLASHAEGGKV